MPEQPFSTTYDAAEARLVVVGAIDTTSEAAFDDALRDAFTDAGDERALRIDLCAVDFLPSSALGILITAARRAGSGGSAPRYVLVATPGSIAARVLEIVGFPFEPA